MLITNVDVRKINYRKSLENSQENSYDEVYFSKVANLQPKNCNSTLNFTTGSFRNKFGLCQLSQNKKFVVTVFYKIAILQRKAGIFSGAHVSLFLALKICSCRKASLVKSIQK